MAAGLGAPSEHALISLLAINGLRVSEAIGAHVESLGIERGHRTLTIVGKGGKIVTIPLGLPTARAIDLAIGERAEGPSFLRPDGQRLDRHAAGRIVHRIARRAGISTPVGRHTPCAMPSSPRPWTPGYRGTCRRRLRTPIPERR